MAKFDWTILMSMFEHITLVSQIVAGYFKSFNFYKVFYLVFIKLHKEMIA